MKKKFKLVSPAEPKQIVRNYYTFEEAKEALYEMADKYGDLINDDFFYTSDLSEHDLDDSFTKHPIKQLYHYVIDGWEDEEIPFDYTIIEYI